jgi:hypothetical protein
MVPSPDSTKKLGPLESGSRLGTVALALGTEEGVLRRTARLSWLCASMVLSTLLSWVSHYSQAWTSKAPLLLLATNP